MAKISKFVARGKAAAPLETPTDLSQEAVTTISQALNHLLADTYALYVKTKNFHWHVSGPHFRSYHLLFDEQAKELFDTTDELAERVRKLGGTTIRSISQIQRLQRIKDNNQDYVSPGDMLRELMNDNKKVAEAMRKAHEVADDHDDSATASMIEIWLDQTEKRTWFLFEAARGASNDGH